MTTQLNQEMIKSLPSKNKTAEALFTYWATRERNARGDKTTLTETRRQLKREGFNPDSKELSEVFLSLHKAGVAQFKNRTLTWTGLGLKEVASMALEKGIVLKTGTSSPVTEVVYKVIVAYLPEDRKIKVELPANITAKEVKMLKSMIDSNAQG